MFSQVDIEQELYRLVQVLEDETSTYAILAQDDARKSARYKAEWAKAYLRAEGAVRERESAADVVCRELLTEAKIAEALLKSKREKLTSTRSSIDALRTLSANVRVQV